MNSVCKYDEWLDEMTAASNMMKLKQWRGTLRYAGIGKQQIIANKDD